MTTLPLSKDDLKAVIRQEGNLSIFVAHGLVCVAWRRPPRIAANEDYEIIMWRGYVGVPQGHPYYGQDYRQERSPIGELDVHGGVTFTGAFAEQPEEGDLLDGVGRLWFIGFDCAHLGDVATLHDLPGHSVLPGPLTATYKNLPYVIRECVKLADQLAHLQEVHHE